MVKSSDLLIQQYGLLPHPEGGFFRETYRSGEEVAKSALPSRFTGARSFSTAILFLLPRGSCSRLHCIRSDEVWHFYAGDPLVVVEITPSGEVVETRLGQGPECVFQYVVQAGRWFGSYPVGEFSLVGCTVAPGFDFADFEMGSREELLAEFPRARGVVERLT